MEQSFTFIEQGRSNQCSVSLEGNALLLAPDAIKAALGWELKPEGICQEDICIPESAHPQLVQNGKVNLNILAELTSKPLAVDLEAQVAYLGASSQERGAQLASLKAPDFELPDLAGKLHHLSDHHGKKILLVAYSSW